MSFINVPCREIWCKIVYYGPGLCGKTTNLRWIHARAAPAQKGRLVELATSTDRTLYFDFMPLELGTIGAFKVRLQLYTVPGQVHYDATRKLVLKGADGVVFVADSQESRKEANVVSLENLRENLDEQGRCLDRLPFVIQYNKRDLDGIMPLDELRALLNPTGVPDFEGRAASGGGVFDTLKTVSRQVIVELRRAYDAKRAG